MNSDQLLKFKKVAECGSMSAAAKELFLAQSTLSYSISQLEDELNVQLFIRDNKRLIITSDGKTLLQYANDIDCILKSATQAFNTNNNISISANNVGAAFLLKNFPQEEISRVKLYNLDERLLADKLIHGYIDIAVCDKYFMQDVCYTEPVAKTQRVSKFLICREQLGLYVPENHRFYNCKSLTYKDLADEPLCVRLDNTAIKSWTRAIYEKNGFKFRLDFQIDEYMYSYFEDWLPYPEIACVNSVVDMKQHKTNDSKNYKLVKIEDEYSSRMVFMWYLQKNSAKVQPFIDGLKKFYTVEKE